jgi:hypothetical protein
MLKSTLKNSEVTIEEHMNQTRKNVRITIPKKEQTSPDEEVEYEQHLTKHINVVYAVLGVKPGTALKRVPRS